VYEAPNGNVLRPCILVIEITLHNDVFMILDLSLTAGAVGQRIRKKPLSVIAYGCMSGGHVSEPGAQVLKVAIRDQFRRVSATSITPFLSQKFLLC